MGLERLFEFSTLYGVVALSVTFLNYFFPGLTVLALSLDVMGVAVLFCGCREAFYGYGSSGRRLGVSLIVGYLR